MGSEKSPYKEIGMSATNIFGDNLGVLADRKRKVNNEYKKRWRAKHAGQEKGNVILIK